MSLGSDFSAEMEANLAVLEWEIDYKARTKTWTTKDGRHLRFSQMSDSHLQNTIRMLERNNECDIYLPLITAMQEELKERHGGQKSLDNQ